MHPTLITQYILNLYTPDPPLPSLVIKETVHALYILHSNNRK